MQNKNKTVWRLYSGATWTLNELADILPYALMLVGIGAFIGWMFTIA